MFPFFIASGKGQKLQIIPEKPGFWAFLIISPTKLARQQIHGQMDHGGAALRAGARGCAGLQAGQQILLCVPVQWRAKIDAFCKPLREAGDRRIARLGRRRREIGEVEITHRLDTYRDLDRVRA